jgi:hypothetical protein
VKVCYLYRNVSTKFNKTSNINFNTNLSSGRLVVPCAGTGVRTDRQADMTKLIVVFAIVLRTQPKENILCGGHVCLYVTQY